MSHYCLSSISVYSLSFWVGLVVGTGLTAGCNNYNGWASHNNRRTKSSHHSHARTPPPETQVPPRLGVTQTKRKGKLDPESPQNPQNAIARAKKVPPSKQRIIFDTSLKIMNYYQPITAIYESEGANYIETFINLFVGFYNKFDNMDLNHVKTIIRPNNVYPSTCRATSSSISSKP